MPQEDFCDEVYCMAFLAKMLKKIVSKQERTSNWIKTMDPRLVLFTCSLLALLASGEGKPTEGEPVWSKLYPGYRVIFTHIGEIDQNLNEYTLFMTMPLPQPKLLSFRNQTI